MSDPSKPKRKWRRASTPKTKTGCKTWIRHLRCDEQKPTCQRCQKDKRICDGYADPVAKGSPNRASPSTTSSLPSPSPRSQAPTSPNILDLITSTVEDPVTTPVYQSVQAGKQVAQPANDAAITINLALHALQTAFRYYMLRHQIQYDGPSSLQPSETDSIQAYDQAIRSLKVHISSATGLNEEAVIACCLMFAAIEAFHNRYAEVGYHLEAVTRLLRTRGDNNEPQAYMQFFDISARNEGVIQFSDHLLLQLLEKSEDYTTYTATELFQHIRSSFTACFGIPLYIDL